MIQITTACIKMKDDPSQYDSDYDSTHQDDSHGGGRAFRDGPVTRKRKTSVWKVKAHTIRTKRVNINNKNKALSTTTTKKQLC